MIVIKYVGTATTPCETVRVKNRTSFVGLQRFRKIKLGRLNLPTLLLSFLNITLHNMVSEGFFSLELNIHTLWTLSPHSAKLTQYYTPDSSVYVHSLISVQKKHLSDFVDLNKLGIWTKPQQFNMAYAIPPPAKMEMHGDLQENWALFKLTWENYAAVTDIGKKAANVQVGTLLSVIGKEYLQIYKNLPMSAEERADTQNYDDLKKNRDRNSPNLKWVKTISIE